jgi:hypothetical protein
MIVPTIGSVLIILFSKNNTLVKNILSQKLFVGLGLISYSAYLWHQPLFAFTRYKMHSDPSSTIMNLLCIVSILLVIFTYIFIEKPIRRKDKFKTNFFLYFIGFFLIIVSFGFFIRSTNGFEKFFISNNKFLFGPRMEFFDLVKKHTGKDPFKNMVNDGVCKFWSQDLSNEFETKFRNCSNYFGKAIIVLGDSHGINAYNIVAKSNILPFVVGLAKPACRPYNTQSNCQYEKFTKFTQNNNSIIKTIIFHQSGSYLDELSIPATLNYLDNLNKYAKVLWLGPHTEARFRFKDISSL